MASSSVRSAKYFSVMTASMVFVGLPCMDGMPLASGAEISFELCFDSSELWHVALSIDFQGALRPVGIAQWKCIR
jgi:hypothetical protein